MRQLKIGTSGIRGVVGDALTPELVVNFACAFGAYCSGGTVVLGRDTRRSSIMMRSAVLSALVASGCEVLDLGICTTPAVSFAIKAVGAVGGISVTGSHNDARWNALKFLGRDGALLNAANTEELLDIYHAGAFLRVGWSELVPHKERADLNETYIQAVAAALDCDAVRGRSFRVAVDYCNGAAIEAGGRLLEHMGCHVIPLNDDPTVEFAHPPAPSRTNMRQLAALIRSVPADIGVAINADGDRIGFVRPDGEPLSEEYGLPLAANHVLRWRTGPVVTNLSTSRMIERVAAWHGRSCVRTTVGEGHVMDRALTDDAAIAGEGNGGVAILPHTATFDALLTLGIVLQSMAERRCTLQDLVEELPAMHMHKGEVAVPPDQVYRVLNVFRERYAEAETDITDGVRLEWPDAWLHVRASSTEPLLRVIAEADTPERAADLFDEAMATARRAAIAHGVR